MPPGFSKNPHVSILLACGFFRGTVPLAERRLSLKQRRSSRIKQAALVHAGCEIMRHIWQGEQTGIGWSPLFLGVGCHSAHKAMRSA